MSTDFLDLRPEVFRTLAANSVDAIAISDLEGKLIYGNRACYEMFGYEYEKREMRGLPFVFLWREEELSLLREEVLSRGMAGGWHGQVCLKRKNGDLFDAYLALFELADEGGQAIGTAAIIRDITERKRAEEALRVSEERFALAVQGSYEGIWDWDIPSGSLYWSPRFKELLGYAEDELEAVFDTFESHLHPDDREHVEAAIEAHLKDRVPYDVEERLRTKSGEYRWFRARGQALWDEAGNAVRFAGSITDITERKLTEEALAEERNLLRTIIDNLPDYIYVKDTESRYIVSNAAHMRVLGATKPEEVVGKKVFDFYPQELAEQYYADDQEVIRSGRPLLDREERSIDEEGNEVWDLTTKVPLRDSEGKIVGLVGIARDMTERKQAEEALAQERYLLRALIDNAPDAIYFKDTDSRFIRINKAHAERWFGLSDPAQAVGKTDFDFFSEEHAQQAYLDEQEIVRTGQPLVNIEEKETWPDGRVTWVSTTKMPLRDAEGHIIGTFGITRDVTEQKRVQEVIEAQRQAIQELSTPIVPVLEGVLVLPLVGSIDTRRAQQIMETLLEAIGRHQAEVVLIDITGVPVVDTGVANHLLQVVRAAALLGTECVLVGISPEVAQTIVGLGVDLSGVATQADLQSGVEYALQRTGRRIVEG